MKSSIHPIDWEIFFELWQFWWDGELVGWRVENYKCYESFFLRQALPESQFSPWFPPLFDKNNPINEHHDQIESPKKSEAFNRQKKKSISVNGIHQKIWFSINIWFWQDEKTRSVFDESSNSTEYDTQGQQNPIKEILHTSLSSSDKLICRIIKKWHSTTVSLCLQIQEHQQDHN